MPFVRIVRINIPMNDTDRHCQCAEYESPMFKLLWSDPKLKHRDRSRQITVEPMALDGEHDPYKEINDCDSEMQRMIKLHGKERFFQCYNVTNFEAAYKASVVQRNEWREAAEARARDEEATAQAAAAVKTAQLVDDAVQGIRRARLEDEQAAEQRDSDAENAAALVGAQTVQAEKPRRGRPPTKT